VIISINAGLVIAGRAYAVWWPTACACSASSHRHHTGSWGLRDYGHAGQLGLESTPDEYVSRMVDVFRLVRDLLADDGTLWLNLGDSYATSGTRAGNRDGISSKDGGDLHRTWYGKRPIGLKEKDLVGIPWMVAKALQAPYYTGRLKSERDRVWLAAMIDGEGTICGFDHDRADNGTHRSGIHIFITNSCAPLLDEAARIWPTSRSEHGRPGPGHLGDLPTWRWIVHGIENKLALLRELYPYLIAKRQQAVVAYSMLLLMADAKRLGHSDQKEAVIAKRAVCTALLSDLNHQRPVTMPDWLTEPPSLYEPGFYLRQDVIWSKPNPMPESVRDRCTKAHEYIFLLSKKERYYFDADAIAEPLAYSSVERLSQPNLENQEGSDRVPGKTNGNMKAVARASWNGSTFDKGKTGEMMQTRGGLKPYTGHATKDYEAAYAQDPSDVKARILKNRRDKGGQMGGVDLGMYAGRAGDRIDGLRNKRSVWTVTTKPYAEAHFATFPPDLIEPCVLAGSKSGDIVLDPFFGSGTTGEVAQNLGRQWIGCELNPQYEPLQRKRTAQMGMAL
jgi:DNA modification methylase